ncbi:MAG: hypothetical protein AAGF11_13930 [Myxococcota bacterium]
MIGGCAAAADRDSDGDDRAVTVATAASVVGIVSGVLSGASSIKNLLDPGDNGEPKIAHLSKEALDEIRDIVTDVTVTFGFEQYINSLNSLVEKIGTYNEPSCSIATDAGCEDELRDASQQLVGLAGQASDIWSSLSSEEDLHAANRMQGALSMVSVAGIRTSLLVERANIDTERGRNGDESWDTACGAAGVYYNRLTRLEDEEFTEYVDSHFGEVYTKQTALKVNTSGGYAIVDFISCFDGPDGEYCSNNSKVTVHCTGSKLEWCASWHEQDGKKIQDTPYPYTLHVVMNERSNARDEHYESLRQTILGGDAFDDLLGELDRISKCEDKTSGPECSGGALMFDNLDDGTGHSPTGTYERSEETFNGEPVFYQVGGDFKIYKRSAGAAAGNWVVDFDGVDEAWGGTVRHTTDKPATPWEGTWTKGTAECVG